jgi:hypothetical protein
LFDFFYLTRGIIHNKYVMDNTYIGM